MDKMEIGVQLYTVRKYLKKPSQVDGVFKKIKEMGASVVQVSGMCEMDSVELGKISKDNNLPICITHSPYKRIKNDLDALAAEHLNFGCKNMGIGMLPKEFDRKNLDSIKEFIEFLNTTAEKLKQYDMTIAYHNHWFEFKKFDDKTMYDIMIENTIKEVQFIPDTYWIKVGGYDVSYYIEKLNGRVNTIHLKDYKKTLNLPAFKPIGDGTLDFKKILSDSEKAGIENAVVELDLSLNPYESLSKSLNYIKTIY
jgi:sugar phosphate isomerase/epimerase